VRILRLALDRDHVVDLHPACSVVAGLDDERAAVLRWAVASIGVGLRPGISGVVEAHGLLLGTTQADLDLLDPGADPVGTVVTPATLAADPSELPEPLRTCEGDVVALAGERHRALAEWRAASAAPSATELDLARAERLRIAIRRHEETDVEPLRVALDRVRDLTVVGVPAADVDPGGGIAETSVATGVLRSRLAALGIDLRPHDAVGPLEASEVRRIAEEWLDEHRRRATWVVGARVELAGIERRMRPSSTQVGGPLPESAERRLARASAALAQALARADEVREGTQTGQGPSPLGPADLEAVLRQEIDRHRRDRLAGAAPLLLQGVLAGTAGAAVGPVLDHLIDHGTGVQLVVVDDRSEVGEWARRAGHRRAALVTAASGPVA
jgi:hypothetical protein